MSLGRRGGKKSAAGRMQKMTPEQRSDVARKAAARSAEVRTAKAKQKAVEVAGKVAVKKAAKKPKPAGNRA